MNGSGLDDDTPLPKESFALKTFQESSLPIGKNGQPLNIEPELLSSDIERDNCGPVTPTNQSEKRHRKSFSHVGISLEEHFPHAKSINLGSNFDGSNSKGHSRSQSHGQVAVAKGHKREGSRAEFILPEGHDQRVRERELRPAKSFVKKSSLSRKGHTREASRTESVYTIRNQKRSLLEKLCICRDNKNESCSRLVVPNPIVPIDVTGAHHPNYCYPSNHIRTTKYSLLSFIPKNLFEQFHRFANLYFLLIVLLNFVPMVTVFMKELAVIPLLFVLSVTAIKDACEDWRRYNNDRRVNANTCKVFSSLSGRYEQQQWKDIRVGDLLQLFSNEVIPADVVVLNTSDDHGICYIESSNLDGETNLKQRQAVREILKDGTFDASKFDFILEVGPPTTKMYHFVASIPAKSGENIALTKDNLILRDCVIKNTDFVEGIVVYAGRETKALLNHGGARYKRSKLERQMNREVIWCVIILFIICVFSATGSGLWQSAIMSNKTNPLIYFLPPSSPTEGSSSATNPVWIAFASFWTFIILYQVLIPISLYVTIEVIKLLQIYHIHRDPDFKDNENGTNIECRALNIPEELGQVQHIFTDKTGTLTENKMVFQRCCFNGKDYDHEAIVDSKDPQLTFLLNTELVNEIATLSKVSYKSSVATETMFDFFFTLATCNSIIVAKNHPQYPVNSCDYADSTCNSFLSENQSIASTNTTIMTDLAPSPWLPFSRRHKLNLSLSSVEEISSVSSSSSKVTEGRTPDDIPKPTYEAESPDELALVNAAYSYGFKLLRRNIHGMAIDIPGCGIKEYEILHVLPFDSNRKRMSIIVKHPDTGQKILYCKGADSSILENLQISCDENDTSVDRVKQLLSEYAKKGLRVLCIAKRELTTEDYLQWSLSHKKAENAMVNRDVKLSESFNNIEKNLQLLGATGIEDSLQDGVPETIQVLREAGIVIWVLTGDKQETAINVAFACSLFTPQTELMLVSARTRDQAERTMRDYHRNLMRDVSYRTSSNPNRKLGLVIDGRTLVFVLDRRAKLSDLFLALTDHCCSVMCCRATPLQKALIVHLIKGKGKVLTLAVGDGANDVSMIKTADVGVGISGVEGRQAVMSSDYAITRFRHLEKLLLVHGHWCYDRLSRVVLYFFYKNACFVFLLMWFQLYCGYSGSSMIDELSLIMFNLIYTSLPPITIGIYDRDCPAEILLSQPKLFAKTRLGTVYTPAAFRLNILDALYQSFVIFFVTAMILERSDAGMYEFGFSISHTCLVTQLLHVSIETRSWTVIHLVVLVASYLGFFIVGLLYTAACATCQPLPSQYGELVNMVMTPSHWFGLLVTCVLALLPRLIYRSMQATLWPDAVTAALLNRRAANKGHFFSAASVSSSSSSVNRQIGLP